MKKFLQGFVALSLGLLVAGCAKEYDDTALKSKVDELSKEVSKLSQDVKDLNAQVVGFKEVIDQWKAGGYVESVQPVKEGDKEVGQTITFLGGKTVTLYYGKDGDKGDKGDQGDSGAPGADGKTPEITVGTIAGAEGLYWLVDGKALEVGGKPVPATVLPVFSINAEGHLMVTINGVEQDLGLVKGAGGDSMFKSIEVTDNGVLFTPATGDAFTVPFAKKFKLVIDKPEQEVAAGKTVTIPYTIQNANASTTVDVFAGGNYLAKVAEGNIAVTAPDPFVNGQVLAWAQNDEGLFSMVKLSFLQDADLKVVTEAADYEAIPAAAGDFEVKVTSNVEVEVKVPETADWLSAQVTKADYKIVLTLAANGTGEPREAEISIVRKDNGREIQTVRIIQLGGDPTPAVLTVERVWGLYNSTSDVDWFKDIVADGAKLAATTDRNIAMDDDYIYFAKSSSYPAILAVDRNAPTDASKAKKLNIDGIAGGTHAISCVRMVKNTDASVNGGKDILLVSNLKGDYELKVYAYLNGIEAAPTQVLIWQWDNHANASDWRRYGDKFTVTGTWQSGAIWFQGWSDGKAICFPLKDGAVDKPNEVSHVIDATASAIKDIAVYPGQETEVLVTSYNKAAFWTNSGSKNANNWVTWTEGAAMESLKNSYGYNFFEFNKKKYIAYTLVEDTKHSRLQVMEDKGAFKASLDAKEGLVEFPLQHASDFTAASPAAGGNNGDCTVRIIGNEVFILAMHTDCGLSLFKMYLDNSL